MLTLGVCDRHGGGLIAETEGDALHAKLVPLDDEGPAGDRAGDIGGRLPLHDRQREGRKPGFQRGMGRPVFGEGVRTERRQEMLPDLVEHALEITRTTGDRDYSVLLRKDEAELAKGAIAAIGVMPASPELVSVPDR